MNPNGGAPASGVLAEAAVELQEGITQVLSTWVALRMATEIGWGDGDSLVNATNLGYGSSPSWRVHGELIQNGRRRQKRGGGGVGALILYEQIAP